MGMSDNSNDAGTGGGSHGTSVGGGQGAGSSRGGSSSAGRGAAGGGGRSTNINGQARGATNGVGGQGNPSGSSGTSVRGGFMSEVDATPSNATRGNQVVSSGVIASMDDVAEEAERSFLDRASFTTYADTPRGYNPSPGLSRAESMVESIASQTGRTPSEVGGMIGQDNFGQMTSGNLSAAYGGVQQASQPHGLLSTVRDVALGFVGPLGMVADTALDSVLGGRTAANTFSSLNDQYGTSFDSSLASNIGRHAASDALGTITSMGLSRFGANAGFGLAGFNGARVGGLLGDAAGQQIGTAALSDQGNRPSTPTNPAQGDAPRGLLASASPSPTVTTSSTSYGPADFDGYASYAESFFG